MDWRHAPAGQGLGLKVRAGLGFRLVPMESRRTRCVALHCTGVGKALLASIPPDRARQLIGAGPLAARTPATITDPDALHAELSRVRARGYALDEGEMEVGVRCVAVGLPGAAPMAMSVSGPAARMTDELVTVAVSALQAASAELYRQLA
jgi:IclR family transcriptional regulator, acetate operon repressor